MLQLILPHCGVVMLQSIWQTCCEAAGNILRHSLTRKSILASILTTLQACDACRPVGLYVKNNDGIAVSNFRYFVWSKHLLAKCIFNL